MGIVSLTLPAQTSYVSLARTLAAAMAARADLPVDQLEDIRLAVDEAVSLLIVDMPEHDSIVCTFMQDGTALVITVAAATPSGATPPTDGFSWTVLSALVDDVTATSNDGIVEIVLRASAHAAQETAAE